MTTEREIDRILTTWLSTTGGDRAPEDRVGAALRLIDTTAQRAPGLIRLSVPHWRERRRAGLGAAAALVIVLLLGAGLAGLGNPVPSASDGATEGPSEPVPTRAAPTQPSTQVPIAEAPMLQPPDSSWRLQLDSSWTEDLRRESTIGAEYALRGREELSVRAGDAFGRFWTCDVPDWDFAPPCRRENATTLARLVEIMTPEPRAGSPASVTRTNVELDGESAILVQLRGRTPGAIGEQWLGYVLAVHDGRPYILRFSGPVGERLHVDTVPVGFEFGEPGPRITEPTYQLRLDPRWKLSAGPDPGAVYLEIGFQQLTVRVGNAKGLFRTCDEPAGPWETCEQATATTLEELVAAMAVEPVVHHSVYPPVVTTSESTLDDEPAMIMRVAAFQPVASGGQWLAYILAVHDGRPYVLRLWNPNSDSLRLDNIQAGFRFR